MPEAHLISRLKTFKYRLYPSKQQQSLLDQEREPADPFRGCQPGTASLTDTDLGVKQESYKSGRLYLSQLTAERSSNDAAYWAEAQLLLTTKAARNPQWVNSAFGAEVGYKNFGGNYDIVMPLLMGMFMPTLMGADVDHLLLVANYSSSAATVYPSIFYVGRKSIDAPPRGSGTPEYGGIRHAPQLKWSLG